MGRAVSPRRRVLLDATALTSYSGRRGIGQMTANLLIGLDDTRAEWEASTEIVALERLPMFGPAVLSPDLRGVTARAALAPQAFNLELVNARRLRLPSIARGFDLLHQTEALGTPWQDAVPRVVTCHDLIPLRMPEHYLPWFHKRSVAVAGARWRYGRAARVVCISERTRRDLIELIHVDADRTEVVPLGLVEERWRTVEDPPDATVLARLHVRPSPFLLYVGGADARKNVAGMMDTLRRLRASRPSIELVWAGALDAMSRARIRRIARTAGVESAVNLVGFVSSDDLVTLFRAASAHLFLSRLEGFGLTVAEALAVGCPVVLGRDSGADEVAGDACLAVDLDDPGAAAAAVERVLDDQGLRQALRQRGLARVAGYRASHMARGYIAAWERVLAG